MTSDLIIDGDTTRSIREALEQLGYTPVDTAKYFQFAKRIEYQGTVVPLKFDFLAPPVDDPALVNMDRRRIRPRSYSGFHARVTPEAATVGESPVTVDLGTEAQPATIRLPHPFTYLLLKLHAFRDQVHNPEKMYGRHHAFDVYMTLALATDQEWREMLELYALYANASVVIAACAIRQELFGTHTALGLVRLREYIQQAGILIVPERFGELVDDLGSILQS